LKPHKERFSTGVCVFAPPSRRTQLVLLRAKIARTSSEKGLVIYTGEPVRSSSSQAVMAFTAGTGGWTVLREGKYGFARKNQRVSYHWTLWPRSQIALYPRVICNHFDGAQRLGEDSYT